MLLSSSLPYNVIWIFVLLSVTMGNAHNNNNLNGVHFVLSVVQNPPYETIVRGDNGNVTVVGVSRNINEWLSRKLNFSLSFVVPPEDAIKAHGWTLASLIEVNSGAANLTASASVITPERRNLCDEITFPIFEETVRLLVPRPSEEDRLFAFILPFDLWVWMLLAATTLIAIPLMACLIWSKNEFSIFHSSKTLEEFTATRSESFNSLLGSYSMYVMDVLTNHGSYVRHTKVTPFAMFVSFWLLGVSVIIFSYSSIVVSSLTAPRLKPSIDSYEALAASKDVALILRTDLVPSKRVLDGENAVYKQIAEKARKHYPESIINDLALTEELLTTGRYAYTWLETYVRFFVVTRYKKEKKCRFEISRTFRGASYYYHPYIKRGLKQRDAFQLGNMQLWETGLTRLWTKNLLPRAEECFAKREEFKGSQDKIKLVDLTSAFFILGVGLGLSLITFLFEVLSAFFYRSRVTRV